jgi:uncharacterized phage protein (TIGR02218 family)
MGAEILRVGVLGNIQRKRGEYVAELRGLMQALQNNIGRTVAPTCDADLGDARCKVNLEALRDTSSVAAVVSQREFLAAGIVNADGWYTGGEVTFVTGDCAGLRMEIKRHTAQGSPATDGLLVLQLPMPKTADGRRRLHDRARLRQAQGNRQRTACSSATAR